MYSCTWELESFDVMPIGERCGLVLAKAKCLASINYQYLTHFAAPPLYESGVRYKDQILGADRWQDIPRLLETMGGACEDLAAWRVAELFMQGERAKIDVDTAQGPGGLLYHVIVKRQNGMREDPSRILGMT